MQMQERRTVTRERRGSDRRAGDAIDFSVRRAAGPGLLLRDSDTGLVSEALFRDRTEHALSRVKRTGGRVALLLLEVAPEPSVAAKKDRVDVAAQVLGQVRPQDTVARLDETYMGILVEDIERPADAQSMRRRLDAALSRSTASSVAVSDSRGRIGFWLGGAT